MKVHKVLLIEPNNNRYGKTSLDNALGGSETVFLFLVEELKKRVDVDLAVIWRDDNFDLGETNFDLIISYRDPSPFFMIQGKINAVLFQDMPNQQCLMQIQQLMNAGKLNRLIFLSHFQKEAYLSQLPRELITEARHCYMFENGLDMSLFDESIAKENSFIYASAPNRGLEQLLEIWPILHQQLPDWKLKIAGGTTMYNVDGNPEEINQGREEFLSIGNDLYKKANEMPGVLVLGPLPHADLVKEFERSKVFLYPNTFPETCCHVLNIALQAGCCPIVSQMGALVEKITSGENGFVVPGDPTSDQFKFNFVTTTIQNVMSGSIDRVCKTNRGSYLGYGMDRLVDRLLNVFLNFEEMEGNNHRILAVCPSLYGNGKKQFKNWKWYSPIDVQTDELVGIPVDQARTSAAHIAVKKEADWLCMVDDDVYTAPHFIMDMIKKALKYNVDVVVCNYFFKEDYGLVPVARVYERSTHQAIDISNLSEEEVNSSKYRFVMAGLGAVLIATKALKLIGRPYFRTQNVQVRHTGEDSYFFQECRTLGIPVWLSLDIPLIHVGNGKVYGKIEDILSIVGTLI